MARKSRTSDSIELFIFLFIHLIDPFYLLYLREAVISESQILHWAPISKNHKRQLRLSSAVYQSNVLSGIPHNTNVSPLIFRQKF